LNSSEETGIHSIRSLILVCCQLVVEASHPDRHKELRLARLLSTI